MTTTAGGELEVVELVAHHGRLRALDGVTLHVAPGEHLAITGANGSGKSTLLRCIAGLHRSTSGVVRIDGIDATSRPTVARRRCAWVPQRQSTGRFPLLVRELLASSGDPARAQAAGEALLLADLLERPLSTLSGGQLQRAFLARALGSLHAGATMLLADEPTAALDFDGQAELAHILRSVPATVVVVTHDRAVVDTCDRHAEMAAGSLREVR